MSKRRKVQKISHSKAKKSLKKFVLEEFLKELKEYKGDPNIDLKKIKDLIRKETRERIEELLQNFFGKSINNKKTSGMHYWSSRRKKGRLKNGKPSKGVLVDILYSYVNRELEKINIKDLEKVMNHNDRFFEMFGITIPREIILIILSYLHCNRKLVNGVGSVNSLFYITILSNWNSEVLIDSTEKLHKISLLVLRSMKYLTIRFDDSLTKSDFEYLFDHLSPDRIRNLSIFCSRKYVWYTDVDNERKRIQDFFQTSIDRNITFPNCRDLYIDPSLFQVLQKYNDEEYHRKEDITQDFSHFLPTLLPNVEYVCNPFFHEKSKFDYQQNSDELFETLNYISSFKKMKHLKKIKMSEESLNVNSFENIMLSPGSLESLQTIQGSNILEFFKNFKLPNLKEITFTIDYSWRREKNPNLSFLIPMKKLQKISFNFNKLFIKRSYNVFYERVVLPKYDGKIFQFNLPKSLRIIEVQDPPYHIFPQIQQLYNIENIEITYSPEFTSYYPENYEPCSLDEYVKEFFEFVFRSKSVKKFDFLILSRKFVKEEIRGRIYKTECQVNLGIVQVIFRRRLKKIWIYGLGSKEIGGKVKKLENVVLNNIKPNIVLVSPFMERKESKEEKKRFEVTSLILHNFVRTRKKDWMKISNRLIPEESKEIVKSVGEGLDEIMYPNHLFEKLHYSAERSYVRFKRMRYFVE